MNHWSPFNDLPNLKCLGIKHFTPVTIMEECPNNAPNVPYESRVLFVNVSGVPDPGVLNCVDVRCRYTFLKIWWFSFLDTRDESSFSDRGCRE